MELKIEANESAEIGLNGVAPGTVVEISEGASLDFFIVTDHSKTLGTDIAVVDVESGFLRWFNASTPVRPVESAVLTITR